MFANVSVFLFLFFVSVHFLCLCFLFLFFVSVHFLLLFIHFVLFIFIHFSFLLLLLFLDASFVLRETIKDADLGGLGSL